MDSWTPLHFAANGNAMETAALLISKGACVNATDKVGDNGQQSVVCRMPRTASPWGACISGGACELCPWPTVDAVVDTERWRVRPSYSLRLIRTSVEHVVQDANTPLFYAVKANATATAALRIEESASVNGTNEVGYQLTTTPSMGIHGPCRRHPIPHLCPHLPCRMDRHPFTWHERASPSGGGISQWWIEARDPVFDPQVALMAMACSHLVLSKVLDMTLKRLAGFAGMPVSFHHSQAHQLAPHTHKHTHTHCRNCRRVTWDKRHET